MSTQHLNIRIQGSVQGVFFRASAQDIARELGIMGYATNEEENTVFIEAEGEEEPLRKFIDWCKQGPPEARVDKVEVETTDGHLKNFTEFKIH